MPITKSDNINQSTHTNAIPVFGSTATSSSLPLRQFSGKNVETWQPLSVYPVAFPTSTTNEKRRKSDCACIFMPIVVPDWIEQRRNCGVPANEEVRRSLVKINCLRLWKKTRYPTSSTKSGIAKQIVQRFPELKVNTGSPEVRICDCDKI